MSQLQSAPKSRVHRDWFLFVSSRKATRQSEADDVARTAGRCVAKIVSTSRLCRGRCVSFDQVQLTLFRIYHNYRLFIQRYWFSLPAPADCDLRAAQYLRPRHLVNGFVGAQTDAAPRDKISGGAAVADSADQVDLSNNQLPT